MMIPLASLALAWFALCAALWFGAFLDAFSDYPVSDASRTGQAFFFGLLVVLNLALFIFTLRGGWDA